MFAIVDVETGEQVGTAETGAAAGKAAQDLNDRYRSEGSSKRVRVKRLEPQTVVDGLILGTVWPMSFYGSESGSSSFMPISYVSDYVEYCRSNGYRIVNVPETGLSWRFRESLKMQPFPWSMADWWQSSEHWSVHFPHPSKEKPGMLAYTPSEDYGLQDRQVHTTPGRYLAKYFGDVLTVDEIQDLAIAWSNEFSAREIFLAYTPEEITEVYTTGPHSCMAYLPSDFVEGHPCRIYGAGDLAVAYIRNENKEITGRAIVWPERKVWGRLYGDIPRLEASLTVAGYRKGDDDDFHGARLLRIEYGNGFVMPYLDYPITSCEDNGDYLIVTPEGSITGGRTDGLSDCADSVACRECGDCIAEEDVWYYNHNEPYCHDCYNDKFSACSHCYEDHPNEDLRISPNGNDILCESCWDDLMTVCEDCGEEIYWGDSYTGADYSTRCGECHEETHDLCRDCGEENLTNRLKEGRCAECLDTAPVRAVTC